MKISEELKAQILKIIFKYLPKDRCTVFLFGSYARDRAKQSSDIDIGIICPEKLDSSQIFLLKEDLNENAQTLRNIDIIDFNSGLDEDFIRIATKKVEIWNKGKELKGCLKNIPMR